MPVFVGVLAPHLWTAFGGHLISWSGSSGVYLAGASVPVGFLKAVVIALVECNGFYASCDGHNRSFGRGTVRVDSASGHISPPRWGDATGTTLSLLYNPLAGPPGGNGVT